LNTRSELRSVQLLTICKLEQNRPNPGDCRSGRFECHHGNNSISHGRIPTVWSGSRADSGASKANRIHSTVHDVQMCHLRAPSIRRNGPKRPPPVALAVMRDLRTFIVPRVLEHLVVTHPDPTHVLFVTWPMMIVASVISSVPTDTTP
jgi:hypothetical protein